MRRKSLPPLLLVSCPFFNSVLQFCLQCVMGQKPPEQKRRGFHPPWGDLGGILSFSFSFSFSVSFSLSLSVHFVPVSEQKEQVFPAASKKEDCSPALRPSFRKRIAFLPNKKDRPYLGTVSYNICRMRLILLYKCTPCAWPEGRFQRGRGKAPSG